jgi:hypothetical protein
LTLYSAKPSIAYDTRDSLTLRTYSHSILGGTSSSAWWDGVRSAQGGAYCSSRSIYHSAEARAISERINGNTTELVALETHLRGAGEYAGTFPQSAVLDPVTFKPYDPQKGNYKWTATGLQSGSPPSTTRPYSYNVPARTGYSWDSAHMYNCGHLIFEATRDPYYALMMQINALNVLATQNLYEINVQLDITDPTLKNQLSTTPSIWDNLPYYIYPSNQNRAWAWCTKEIVKAYHISLLCPTVAFLHPSSTFNTMINDDVTYVWNAQAANIASGDLTSTNKITVINGVRKLLGIYGHLGSGGLGTKDSPYGLSYSGLFNVYLLGALFYNVLSGRTQYLPHFTTILEGFCDATLTSAGGQRLAQVYPWSTKAGNANFLLPTTSSSTSDYQSAWSVIIPAPFSTLGQLVGYWETNSDTWPGSNPNNFNNNSAATQVPIGQQFLMILRAVKQMNDSGSLNIIPSKIDTTLLVVLNQISTTNKIGGGYTNWGLTSDAIVTVPSITTTTLANGISGTAYNQTLTANGSTPIAWSIVSGNISPLTLNTSTGAITGTPNSATTLTATYRATNAYGTNDKSLSIIVSAT